ncbi:MAG: hypothetical protein ACLUHE_09040 [Christensenellales bacterium]
MLATERTTARFGEKLADGVRESTRGAVGAVLNGYGLAIRQRLSSRISRCFARAHGRRILLRTYVFKWRCPIEIGRVTIHNGDIVFGDIDGVLIIYSEGNCAGSD